MKRTPLKRGAPLKSGGRLKRRKPMKRVSPEQKARLTHWATIKRRKLQAQRDERGHNFCEQCGKQTRLLDLDHIKPTGKGGEWIESNARLICRDDHEDKHGRPQWS